MLYQLSYVRVRLRITDSGALPDAQRVAIYPSSTGVEQVARMGAEWLAESDFGQRVIARRCFLHPRRHQMAVRVERHRRRGMPGDCLQELDVGPAAMSADTAKWRRS
jgi:hypothetical protein